MPTTTRVQTTLTAMPTMPITTLRAWLTTTRMDLQLTLMLELRDKAHLLDLWYLDIKSYLVKN